MSPTARPVSDIAFSEVATAAGLNYRWIIPGKRPMNLLQTIGNGCAFLDYDGDGNLDILLVGPRVALYKGDGKGHFTDVSSETGIASLKGNFLGCAVGDYDNDGYEDIYLTAYRGGVLLHNQQGKRFEDVTKRAGIAPQPWATAATFVDMDNDGRLDLYIANYVRFGPDTIPQLCKNNGILSACGPRFYDPEPGVLYHNDGGGRFHPIPVRPDKGVISGKALGVAAADYDGSGKISLAIANDEMAGDLLTLNGNGFKNVGKASGMAYDVNGNLYGGMGIDWGDYDNDGKLDLVIATFQRETKPIFHNDGGLFQDASRQLNTASVLSYLAFGIKWVDFDNDGWLDLIVTNGHVYDNTAEVDKTTTFRQPTQILQNHQGTEFTDISATLNPAVTRPIVGRGLAIGDYDNDGKVDALIVDSEGTPLLLHNESKNVGHYLSLNLVGKRSNRDGFGAQVIVEAGGKHLLRQCSTDGSYMSASDKRVQFGLGNATQADRITVHWPDGKKTTLKSVAVDQHLTISEDAAGK